MSDHISRRTFLKGSLAAGGLTIAVSVGPLGTRLLNASQAPKALKEFNPSIWFKITPDNLVTTVIGSSEMGQGAHSALSMILADELEADWKQVRVQQGPAAKEFTESLFQAPAHRRQLQRSGLLRYPAAGRRRGAVHAGPGRRGALEGFGK